jgi:aerobic carbon-monoxide dehydrogenase medium subunit
MPPAFHRPTTVEDAVSLLCGNKGAIPLAGGQTLVAMMNGNLIDPPALVSLRRIASLRQLEVMPQGLRIGAMVPHSVVEKDARLVGAWAVIREAAAQIAHPAIRAFGTIGGAIAHADPNADYPTALAAADAVVEVMGANGPRRIPVSGFFVDYMTAALEAGELVVAIHVPANSDKSIGAYERFARVDGDYAIVSVAVVASFDKGMCTQARIAVGSCGPTPLRREESERALVGSTLDEAAVRRAGALLAEAAEPVDDVRASADLRRRLIPRLLQRALERAKRKAGV